MVNKVTAAGLYTMSDTLVQLMNEINDWDLMNEVMSVHSSFIYVYQDHLDGLVIYIGLLKRCLMNSGGHQILNRHCISQILRLVISYPDYFKVNVALIVDICQSVHELISNMQMAQLLQVLAALSNIVDDEAEKMELLKMAVAPSLEFFMTIDSAFDSVRSFISYNGFDNQAPTSFEEGETREDILRRKSLRRNLTAVEGVLQQINTDSLLGKVLVPLYPIFFRMARVLQQMYTFEARSILHPSFGEAIIGITLAEKQQIYCSVGESMEAVTGKSHLEERRDPIVFARQYINELNDHIVNIISLLASKFWISLSYLTSIVQLLDCTTINLEFVPCFRLRYWIKKGWKSLICGCPNDKKDIIRQLFTKITTYMNSHLEQMWTEVSNIDYDSEPTEAELFHEHMTCVLSREYLLFLRTCYLTNDVTINSGDDKRTGSMSYLGEWLFHENVSLSSVIMTVFAALTWRDTQSTIRAIPLCKMLAEKLSSCYDDQVGVYMLVSAIRSLHIHGSDEVAGAPLLGLIFHIYFHLRRFSDSLFRVLMQVPDTPTEAIHDFDRRIHSLISGEETIIEKQKREMVRKLLRNVISLTVGEQHRRPVYLRPLPPIHKRRKVDNESEDDYLELSALFGEG